MGQQQRRCWGEHNILKETHQIKETKSIQCNDTSLLTIMR